MSDMKASGAFILKFTDQSVAFIVAEIVTCSGVIMLFLIFFVMKCIGLKILHCPSESFGLEHIVYFIPW